MRKFALIILLVSSQNSWSQGPTTFISANNSFLKGSALNPGISVTFSTPVESNLMFGAFVGVTHYRYGSGIIVPVGGDIKLSPTDKKSKWKPYMCIAAGYGIRDKQLSSSFYSKGGFYGSAGAGIIDTKKHFDFALRYVNYSTSLFSDNRKISDSHAGGLLLSIGIYL